MELRGKVAVVTGAASGIGLGLATAFVAEGARVVMADIDGELVTAEAARVGSEDVVVGIGVDVRDPDSLEAAAQLAVDRFGGLHVAVNNAGIVRLGWSWDMPIEDWRDVLDVNLWGVIHGIRAFVPRILDTGEEGHVVSTASAAAVAPMAITGPYSASKHAVLGLMDVLRYELAEKGAPVGVSVLMPGQIRTGMNPGGQIEPATVAANVVDAIRTNRPYIFTDDEFEAAARSRLAEIAAAFDQVIG